FKTSERRWSFSKNNWLRRNSLKPQTKVFNTNAPSMWTGHFFISGFKRLAQRGWSEKSHFRV
ncbi:MAG: hypothetical protein ABF391_10610, partial [Akkermansiaceae bacterium]